MVMAWQLKSWGSAQAGNRASKTGRYLQWWDSVAEQSAVASAEQNLHHSTLSIFLPSKIPRFPYAHKLPASDPVRVCDCYLNESRMVDAPSSFWIRAARKAPDSNVLLSLWLVALCFCLFVCTSRLSQSSRGRFLLVAKRSCAPSMK